MGTRKGTITMSETEYVQAGTVNVGSNAFDRAKEQLQGQHTAEMEQGVRPQREAPDLQMEDGGYEAGE
jgi:hypothetical protein